MTTNDESPPKRDVWPFARTKAVKFESGHMTRFDPLSQKILLDYILTKEHSSFRFEFPFSVQIDYNL